MIQRLSLAVLATALWLVVPATASAQEPPPPPGMEPEKAPPAEEEGIGTAEDPNVPEDQSINDEPDDPDAMTTGDNVDGRVAKKARPRPTKSTYPTELVMRPVTLTANQAQVSLSAPVTFADGGNATQVLRGAYGVTQDIQIGVSYGFGLQRFSADEGQKGYEPGKAMSVDGAYTLLPDKLALQVSFPIYFQPFVSSVLVGAPFRFRLTDKLALFGGHDLVEVAFNKWPVSVANPGYNLGQVAFDVPGQSTFDRGAINVNFGAQVQYKPNMALTGEMGVHFPDFKDADAPISLFLGMLYTKGKALDLGVRAGFGRLDETDSFTLELSAAYRL